LSIKKQIFGRIKEMYPKDKQEGATDEWINDAIILEIKDNTPYAQRGY